MTSLYEGTTTTTPPAAAAVATSREVSTATSSAAAATSTATTTTATQAATTHHACAPAAATASDATTTDATAMTHVLGEATLEAVARYIVARDVRRVLVLLGAGVSVAAGIPDFRSAGSGLYAKLADVGLDDPADVFALWQLRTRPELFYRVAREMNLWPGAYTPTAVHHFVRLLADAGRLLRCCTQNIDGLERAAGVPPELLVEAHGSFATAACIECHAAYDVERNRHDALHHRRVSRCTRCGGVVKPGIVFFGENLPERFWSVLQCDTRVAELVLIIGTSLQVQPFASLPSHVKPHVPRVVFDMHRVGGRMFRFLDDPPEMFAACASSASCTSSVLLDSDAEETSYNDDDDDDEGDDEVENKDDDDAAGAATAAKYEGDGSDEQPQQAANMQASSSSQQQQQRGDVTAAQAASGASSDGDKDDGDDSSASSSEGDEQRDAYYTHPTRCRDVLVRGDCQASVRRLAELLGMGERLADALASSRARAS